MAAQCKMKSTEAYFESLDSESKARYISKTSLIDKIDPYTLSKSDFSDNVELLPDVRYPDIVNYLIYTPSLYTLEDLRAYKSLDAYNQLTSGWVRDVTTKTINNLHLVTSKVMHSQRMREAPLKPWIILEKDGKVVAAHCNCMAGLGEACSHIAATLFWIRATVKIRNSKTVTQEKAYWMVPSGVKEVPYCELVDIDFQSAKSKKKSVGK